MAGMDMAALAARLGTVVQCSDWVSVDQAMIDVFADVTRDPQYIHIDPEAARNGPFGTTVAHGFLTVSLLSLMLLPLTGQLEGVKTSVNYGFDRLRLLSPVPSGARLRGVFTLTSLAPRGPGQVMMNLAASVEIEGQDRPALAADWLVLLMLDPVA